MKSDRTFLCSSRSPEKPMRAERIIAIALISALLACGLRTVAQQSEPRATSLAREVRHQLLFYYSVFDNLGFRVEGSNRSLCSADLQISVDNAEPGTSGL